jgi:uracil phosphoribosyltransferase
MSQYPNLTVLDHPLIQHKLGVLRDKETSKKTFRALVDEISMLMGYEVTKDLRLEDKPIETPLERMTARKVSGK